MYSLIDCPHLSFPSEEWLCLYDVVRVLRTDVRIILFLKLIRIKKLEYYFQVKQLLADY